MIKSTLFSILLLGIFAFPTGVVSMLISVSFETPIVYQFPMKLPTHLLSVIIQA